VALGLAGAPCLSTAGEDRPHVLMIAVDDLRPMLGCYGDSRAKTPHIDRLAERGMLFERAYCQYAKCGPSRLSIMTGLRPDAVGVFGHGDHLVEKFRARRADAVSMAEWFKDHGYESRSFGKIDHDGWADPSEWSAPPAAGRDGEMLEIVPEDAPLEDTIIADRFSCPVMQSPDVPDDHFFAGRMTGEVVDLLADRDDDRPFFFAVGYRRPHLPFVAPQRYRERHDADESWLAANPRPPEGVPPMGWFNSDGYGGAAKRIGLTMPERPEREEAIAWNGYEMRSYLGVPPRGPIPESRQLELLRAYAACVSYVDAQVGRLLEALERAGLAEETVVVLWSDHGWHLGEMSAWGKMTNYEVATRVPFIVSAPGMPAGRTGALAELVDLYPTLCDLAGLEAPDHLAGASLRPVLEDPDAAVKEAARSQYRRYRGRFTGRAIRTDRHRYVAWSEGNGEVGARELYDHEADPHETTNIAEREPERVAELQRLLDRR